MKVCMHQVKFEELKISTFPTIVKMDVKYLDKTKSFKVNVKNWLYFDLKNDF